MSARNDAVATARKHLADQVVARLMAQLRGDGQQSLDLWSQTETNR